MPDMPLILCEYQDIPQQKWMTEVGHSPPGRMCLQHSDASAFFTASAAERNGKRRP